MSEEALREAGSGFREESAKREGAQQAGATVAGDASAKPRVRYTLRPVVKPLQSAAAPAGEVISQGLRAESEDDDGYDPYSDFHDGTAKSLSFEADPWR